MQIICTTDSHGYNTENYNLIFEKFPGGIFLDSGDIFHGNKITNKVKGENLLPFVERYTAICPGNHDYLYGIDRLKEIGKTVDIVACNLYDKKSNELIFDPFKIVGDIGIIGLASNLNLPRGCKVVKGKALYEIIQNYISLLKNEKNVNTVILLTHLPLSSSGSCGAVTCAKNLIGLDIILCGHAHKKVDRIIRDKKLNPVIAMQAGDNLKCYGLINVHSKILDRKIYDI